MLVSEIMATGGFERIDATIERFRANTFGENYELMLKAVERHGQALKFASFERLEKKLIHNLVLTAVRSSGMSLAFAPPEMQNHKDLVIEAVKQNGLALQYAGEESMRTRQDIVEKAVQSSPKVLQHVPPALRKAALEEQEIQRMEELAHTKRHVQGLPRPTAAPRKSVRPHVASQKPKKALRLTLLGLQSLLEHTQEPSAITWARTAIEKQFNSVTDEEKRDYLDVLFDRDVALSGGLKSSVFACLAAYKQELSAQAPLQIDVATSQPLPRYSMSSTSPSKNPPVMERDQKRTVTAAAHLHGLA
eukprot:g8523.t1